MTQFLSKSFSVALGLNEQGRKNYERIFGKKRKPSGKSSKPTTAMLARSRADDAHEKRVASEKAMWERCQNAPPWNGKNQGQL
jgi:hypothetical protein